MAEQQKKKKQDRDWHTIVTDIGSWLQIGGAGPALYNAIQSKKIRGNPLMMTLTCGGCAGTFLVALDRLTQNHVSAQPSTPEISCTKCGHTDDHEYIGLK